MNEQRKTNRFTFEKSLEAAIVSIDGTWSQRCLVEDVSDAGAKVTLERPLKPSASDEFFLVFTKMGCVYRRCQRRWLNGEQMGVLFLKMKNGKLVARSNQDHDKADEKPKGSPAQAAWLI